MKMFVSVGGLRLVRYWGQRLCNRQTALPKHIINKRQFNQLAFQKIIFRLARFTAECTVAAADSTVILHSFSLSLVFYFRMTVLCIGKLFY